MTLSSTLTHTHDTTGFETLDPSTTPSRDAVNFREIIAASRRVHDAEAELHAAIARAQQASDSWTVIGAALGVTRQAAQKRFGHSA
ncbi:hypothetical protein HMPREF1979_02013 [Actinomyces johnsonii F0542]|uniref:Uncharacterized protein n=1 Tax=Actinomyces johnsonii F0542 TaxID=1321818 RepID=U1RX56_9ACTO|nr:hypothetical protein [Actinomyces johnsonii]ERH22997.1 hypothetical protein HMPREF1979_02013 [Actinomyces johnsonii F0542]